LRIPDKLHERLVAIAKRQERSLNAQILYVLKTWVVRNGAIQPGLPVELESLDSTVKQEGGGDSDP